MKAEPITGRPTGIIQYWRGCRYRGRGKEQTMSNQTDKKEYCAAEQLGTVCYHQSVEFCQLCKRNEDDRKRLLQEVGIANTKRSRR